MECLYLYDFGDGWRHDVRIVGLRSLEETFQRRLAGGARAFSPEDCGGVPGYQRCLQAVEAAKDPEGEDVVEMWTWFDLEALKRQFDR